jgi:predicted MFS family arabinose efflux permease
VLIYIFPPLVKNVLGADARVATLFTGILSIGIAIGSVAINRLLKSQVSARFAPASVIAMGGFVLLFYFVCLAWNKHSDVQLTTLGNFLVHPMAGLLIIALLGVAITGGMFVVPLYAFLTTTVPKSETARTVAANNIVNSGAMVLGLGMGIALSSFGVGLGQLLVVAAMCVISAWLGWKLHLACDVR